MAMLEDLSEQQLRDMEERLYDRMVAGDDVWFEYDQLMWEFNRRGVTDTAVKSQDSA